MGEADAERPIVVVDGEVVVIALIRPRERDRNDIGEHQVGLCQDKRAAQQIDGLPSARSARLLGTVVNHHGAREFVHGDSGIGDHLAAVRCDLALTIDVPPAVVGIVVQEIQGPAGHLTHGVGID